MPELVGETFIGVRTQRQSARSLIEDYLERSGLDIKPAHEVDNLAHGDVAGRLDPRRDAHARLCEESPAVVRDQPSVGGEAPTIDLVVGYNKANTSPILKLFLSRLEELQAPVPEKKN